MKLEELWPWGSEEVVQRFEWTDGQTDRRGVITIAHPEPSAQVS